MSIVQDDDATTSKQFEARKMIERLFAVAEILTRSYVIQESLEPQIENCPQNHDCTDLQYRE